MFLVSVVVFHLRNAAFRPDALDDHLFWLLCRLELVLGCLIIALKLLIGESYLAHRWITLVWGCCRLVPILGFSSQVGLDAELVFAASGRC